MYQFVLAVHNIVRWIVLISGIIAIVLAFVGWLGKKEWTDQDRRMGLLFTVSLDIQLLLGLILYFFLSPITKAALQGMSDLMSDAGLRFFALEHAFLMLLAIVFAHLGSALPRRVEDPVAKHRRAAICFTLAILMLLLGMPWMRPFFPGL
ncbi:MAG: hypothetical protein PVF74_12935 [Anaerolineales bacterium]